MDTCLHGFWHHMEALGYLTNGKLFQISQDDDITVDIR